MCLFCDELFVFQLPKMPADIPAYCYAAVVAAGGIMGFSRAGRCQEPSLSVCADALLHSEPYHGII